MVDVFTCRYFLLPYWNYNSGEMDEIKTIIIAKSLLKVLKIEKYRAYIETICWVFDGYSRSY